MLMNHSILAPNCGRRPAWPRWGALALLIFCGAGPIGAQSVVMASPDVTVALGAAGVVASQGDVVADSQLGIVMLENLGTIPTSVDVIAYGEAADGSQLLAFDTTVSLPGGVLALPGDVVARLDGVYVRVFDALAAGVAPGVRVDATSSSLRRAKHGTADDNEIV